MILIFVKRHLRFLGLNDSKNNADKSKSAFFWSCLTFVSLGIFTIPTFCFFLFEASTFSDYVNSFFFTICGLLGFSFKISLLLEQTNLNRLIIKLEQTFVQRRGKNAALKQIYDEAMDLMELLTKWIHRVMLQASVPIISLQFVFWSFTLYIRSDYSNQSFRLIYPSAVPYEWRSPYRYLSVIPFQLIGIVSCSEVCVVVLCLYTGLCVIMTTIAVDIERCLAELNSEIMINAETGTNQAKIIKNYYEIIQFHSDSKESAMTFVTTFQNVIASYFTYSTISISSLLLCIQGSDLLDAIQPAVCLNVVMTWLFIYCYFGDKVTSQFSSICDTLCSIDWYLLPLNIQKTLPMVVFAAERFVYLKGFGSTSCTRETFKRIVNAGFSYFTMLRQVNAPN